MTFFNGLNMHRIPLLIPSLDSYLPVCCGVATIHVPLFRWTLMAQEWTTGSGEVTWCGTVLKSDSNVPSGPKKFKPTTEGPTTSQARVSEYLKGTFPCSYPSGNSAPGLFSILRQINPVTWSTGSTKCIPISMTKGTSQDKNTLGDVRKATARNLLIQPSEGARSRTLALFTPSIKMHFSGSDHKQTRETHSRSHLFFNQSLLSTFDQFCPAFFWEEGLWASVYKLHRQCYKLYVVYTRGSDVITDTALTTGEKIYI